MSAKASDYHLNDVREFFMRRPFLAGDRKHHLISTAIYDQLKDRTAVLPPNRAAYLRAFIDGWKRAKE